MHYSLSLTPQSEEGIKKEAIAGALSEHFESLVEQVEPEVVANKLYGIAVLDSGEVERTSEGEEPARLLMQLLKKKLWKNPGWFVDVCKIFRACGVKAISQVIGRFAKTPLVSIMCLLKALMRCEMYCDTFLYFTHTALCTCDRHEDV